jgi:hypothetical protein
VPQTLAVEQHLEGYRVMDLQCKNERKEQHSGEKKQQAEQ